MARGKVKAVNPSMSLRKHPVLKLLSLCYNLKNGNKYIGVWWPLSVFFMCNADSITVYRKV